MHCLEKCHALLIALWSCVSVYSKVRKMLRKTYTPHSRTCWTLPFCSNACSNPIPSNPSFLVKELFSVILPSLLTLFKQPASRKQQLPLQIS